MTLKITMLGSGNLSFHLTKEFHHQGHRICQVFSRNIENAQSLASVVDAKAISDLNGLDNNADIYFICLKDNLIEEIIDHENLKGKRLVHTSGTISLNVFGDKIKNCGVFYPFQTFTKNREIDFKNIPICIESNNDDFKLLLNKLALQISNKVLPIDSDRRKFLHLSGVFANNFVNYLYSVSEELLKEKQLPFEIIHELIKETSAKAVQIGPSKAQTGPAIRNDVEIQKKHLDLLSSKPEYSLIYDLLSKCISLKYK